MVWVLLVIILIYWSVSSKLETLDYTSDLYTIVAMLAAADSVFEADECLALSREAVHLLIIKYDSSKNPAALGVAWVS